MTAANWNNHQLILIPAYLESHWSVEVSTAFTNGSQKKPQRCWACIQNIRKSCKITLSLVNVAIRLPIISIPPSCSPHFPKPSISHRQPSRMVKIHQQSNKMSPKLHGRLEECRWGRLKRDHPFYTVTFPVSNEDSSHFSCSLRTPVLSSVPVEVLLYSESIRQLFVFWN